MFNIDIASLRDPGTLASVKAQLMRSALIISAFEGGAEDATDGSAYTTSLQYVVSAAETEGLALTATQKASISEAYNLGWDTVRLNRGVKS